VCLPNISLTILALTIAGFVRVFTASPLTPCSRVMGLMAVKLVNPRQKNLASLDLLLVIQCDKTGIQTETHRPSMTIIMSPSSICSLSASSNLLVAFISFGSTYNTRIIVSMYHWVSCWSTRALQKSLKSTAAVICVTN